MRGFTLVEMLIALVIASILAAIAHPSYDNYVTRSNRSDGFVTINEIIQAQERYFVDELTYTADLTDLGYATVEDVASPEGHYQLSASACAGETIGACVLISAAAQGSQAADGDLTLNSRGTRTGNW